MRSRTGVSLAGAALVAVAAMAPAAGAVTAAPSGWQVVPSPNPPNGAALAGVTALSPTNFWAVGVDIAPDRSGRPFILHQPGTRAWHAVHVPALRSVSGRLAAVSAGSANDVWAVGVRAVPGAPLTAHFDGHTWRLVPSGPVGSGAALLGVATLSSTNAWAVGSRQSGPSTATLVEHWYGKAWQVVPSPNPEPVSSVGARRLGGGYGVRHPQPQDRDRALERHDVDPGTQPDAGPRWRHPQRRRGPGRRTDRRGRVRPGQPGPYVGPAERTVKARTRIVAGLAVAGTVVAVWAASSADAATLRWTVEPVAIPAPAQGSLSGVAAVADNDVWAVGTRRNPTAGVPAGPVLLHNTGNGWMYASLPSVSGGRFTAVAAPPGHDVWAVGSRLGHGVAAPPL